MKNSPFIRFAIVFLGSLMATYLLSFSCSKDTKNKQDMSECYKFADEHWSRDDYKAWLYDSLYNKHPDQNIPYELVSDTFPYWDKNEHKWAYLSHHLPDNKTEQYYEMIGKYEQFRWGWEDYSDDTHSSPHRDFYMECRRKAGGVSETLPTMPQ
jgi:hypothetical protein